MATTLTGLRVQDTYNAIIKIGDNSTLTGTGKLLSDGFGNNSNLYLSTTSLGIGVAPTENLHISGSMRLTGSFKDKNNQSGTTGQVLTSTATGTDWKTISDIDGVTSATGGTANYVPIFTSARNIENSIIQASATLVTISGNLDVNGTVTYIDTIDLSVKDPLIKLANANVSNTLDIGFYGKYVVSATTKYLGLYSDASDSNKFRLFTGLETEPLTVVDSSDTTFAVGTLIANFEGNLTGNVAGNVTGNLSGNVTGGTISGTTGTFSNTLTANGGINGLTLLNGGITGTNYNIAGVNQLTIADPGEGIVFTGTTTLTLAVIDDTVDDKLKLTNATQLDLNSTAKITNLVDPTTDQDAATKKYVDDSIPVVPDPQSLSNVLGVGNTSGSNNLIIQDNDELILGSGTDFRAYHNETNTLFRINTGDLIFNSFVDDGDIKFQLDNGADPAGLTEYMRLDGGTTNIVFSKPISGTTGSFSGLVTGIAPTADLNFATKKYVDDNIPTITTPALSAVLAAGNTSGANDLKMADDQKIILGDDNDVDFLHTGGAGYLINKTGNLYIENLADDRDIQFIGDDGLGGSAVYFFMDGSEKRTKFLQNLEMVDNNKLILGSDDDSYLKWDSSASQIFIGGESKFLNDLYVVGNQNIGNTLIEADRILKIQTAAEYNSEVQLRESTDNYGFTMRYNGTANQFKIIRHNNSAAGVDVITIGRTANTVAFSGGITTASNSTFDGITMGGVIDMVNNNINNINSLYFNDAGAYEGINWNGGNLWRIFESPDDLSNASGNLQFVKDTTRSMTLDTDGNLFVLGTTTSDGISVSKQLSAASTIDYPVIIASRDDDNIINQLGGEGIGLQFNIAGNDGANPGNSLIGASIAGVRESSTDTDSSTSLKFFISQNDETLDEALVIQSDKQANFSGPVKITNDAGIIIRTTTNGAGAKINFSDQLPTDTQQGTLYFAHADNASIGSGAAFHFDTTETQVSVVSGDATSEGNFLSYSRASTAEVDFGFVAH